MITVEISGGLGNQMFKYACGYAVAKKYGHELSIDTAISDHVDFRKFELDSFQTNYCKRISYHRGTSFLDRALLNRVNRRISIRYPKIIRQGSNPYQYVEGIFSGITSEGQYYLYGGWANSKYFQDIRDDLLEIFTPKEIDAEISNHVTELRNCESVGIHVRRGDYVTIGVTLDERYYKEAIAEIIHKNKERDLQFFIFSDDLDYCKCLFAGYDDNRFHYITYKNPNKTVFDMYLMRFCKNLITANSTYSWWAGYLNNEKGLIIAPVTGCWTEDIYPNDWEKIKVGE